MRIWVVDLAVDLRCIWDTKGGGDDGENVVFCMVEKHVLRGFSANMRCRSSMVRYDLTAWFVAFVRSRVDVCGGVRGGVKGYAFLVVLGVIFDVKRRRCEGFSEAISAHDFEIFDIGDGVGREVTADVEGDVATDVTVDFVGVVDGGVGEGVGDDVAADVATGFVGVVSKVVTMGARERSEVLDVDVREMREGIRALTWRCYVVAECDDVAVNVVDAT